jgi:hypothetical protein
MTTAKRTDPRKGIPGANRDRGKNPVRGVRIEEDLWDAVKAKADAAGSNRNTVIVSLLRGYVSGAIDLPEE